MFKYAATSDKKDAIKSDALYGEIVKLFKTVTYMNDATTFWDVHNLLVVVRQKQIPVSALSSFSSDSQL